MENKNYVYLDLRGFDYNPEIITDSLGLIPFKSGIKGDPWIIPNSKNKPNRKNLTNFWSFRAIEPSNLDAEYHLDKLIEKLLPVKRKIVQITNQYFGGITFLSYFYNTPNPQFIITKEQSKVIGELGLELWFDIYALTE